jgi:hypothetical protein
VLRGTIRTAVIASLALLTVGAAGAASSTGSLAELQFGSQHVMDTAVTSNWAGYVATAPAAAQPSTTTGLSFSDVAGSWVQPKLTCSAGEVGAAAFWVGLGGSQDSSLALEQIGTEGDCNRSGKATYSAWYEFVPAGPVTIKLKVRPGNHITGAVLVSGTQVVVSLKNLSTHKRFSKTFSSVTPLDTTSAEWIAEAPSLCFTSSRCTVVPLPNFGAASFTNATAVANEHPGTLSDPVWSSTPVALAPDPAQMSFGVPVNSHGALPSSIFADGRSFSVTWQETSSLTG